MQSDTDLRSGTAGFSLIEVLIVVAIIGILAAIGYPSYQNYVVKGKRTLAKAELLKIAGQMEQYRANNKVYPTVLTTLGYGADPVLLDDEGQETTTAADAVYSIDLTGVAARTYTIVATPKNAQATADTACANLSITQDGTKSETGTATVADCW